MNTAHKIRVAIAGYGVVGQRRRKYIDLHPALETVAVCDRKFEDDGVFEDGVAYCQRPEDLLKHDFDALFVCLTNDVAPDVTILGLQKNAHVFCEKPPGRNVQDIKRVIEVERGCPSQKLKYGFNHRYHDSVREALSIVRGGEFGRVLNLRGVYGKSKFISYGEKSVWRTQREVAGGGILLDQGIHLVDLMRLFGGEFTEVHSFISNDYWKHDIEDNAYALMKTDANVVGMLHSSATQWRHRFSLEVAMEKGGLVLSGILSGSKSYGAETLTIIWAGENDQGEPKEQMTRYNNDPSWQGEIEDFADAILTDRKITEGSSQDALKTMQLVFDIYRADPQWRAQWGL